MKKAPYIDEISVECCHTKIHTMKCKTCPSLRHCEKVWDLKQKFKTIFSIIYILFIIYTQAHNFVCEFVGTGNIFWKPAAVGSTFFKKWHEKNILVFLHQKDIKKFAKHVEMGKIHSDDTQKHILPCLAGPFGRNSHRALKSTQPTRCRGQYCVIMRWEMNIHLQE